MKYKKEDLDNLISPLKIIFNNPWRDHHRNIYFHKGYAINNNSTMVGVIPFEGIDDMIIPGAELQSFLSRTTATEINVEEDKVSGGRTRFSYKPYGGKFDPDSILENVPKEFTALPEGFWEAVKFVLPGVHPNRDTKIANCVYFNDNELIASDSHRFLIHKLSSNLGVSFCLKAFEVKEIMKFGFTEFSLHKDWIYFRKDNTIIGVSIVKEQYYNYKSILSDEGEYIEFDDSVQNAMKEVETVLFSTEFLDKQIEMTISEGEIFIKASGISGEIDFTEPVDSSMEACFKVNPYYLRHGLDMDHRVLIQDRGIRVEDGDKISIFVKEDVS